MHHQLVAISTFIRQHTAIQDTVNNSLLIRSFLNRLCVEKLLSISAAYSMYCYYYYFVLNRKGYLHGSIRQQVCPPMLLFFEEKLNFIVSSKALER